MKKIIAILFLICVLVMMVSCSSVITKYDYTSATIYFPSGSSNTYEIESYTISGELIEIVTTNGYVFLVHSENCILRGEK